MQTLLAIREQAFGTETVQAINARDLHSFLESKQHYSDWLKNRIEKYTFVRDVDYLLHKIMIQHESGAKNTTECFISLDVAKELSMVESNEKGRQARRYFIDCEKKFKSSTKPTPSVLDVSTEMLGLAKLFSLDRHSAPPKSNL